MRRPVVWVVLVSVLSVVLVLVVWLVPALLTRHPDIHGPERYKAMSDIRTGLIALLGAAAGAGGLAYTARTFQLSQLGQLTGRFQTASEQIGDQNAAVRLAGIHAMALLADDWIEHRQTCIDVVCAYLRLDPKGAPAGDPEVRRTALRLIRDHLRPEARKSWRGMDFDLTDAVVEDGDLSRVMFSSGRLSFRGATFVGKFRFDGAQFSGGEVRFDDATFARNCKVTFSAQFSGGMVCFGGANFEGGEVHFDGAEFNPSCEVSFDDAKLRDGGGLFFYDAKFQGSKVHFIRTQFQGKGEVHFDGARFRSDVRFDYARFDADVVHFDNAAFSGGRLSLANATLGRGKLEFKGAKFVSSSVSLEGAKAPGGSIDFSELDGEEPPLRHTGRRPGWVVPPSHALYHHGNQME